ncbi:hypothetical protein [Yoonia vestfoldensis]|uniref:Uncharacterized protein n=1 Tax=Yoonia vestfoldensis TaxID=245188 RepID=A0A1Y0EEL8_9RHOB|nr:hypothetical protein [Yoonia vestfoldensis]ARU01869.1 hypothetical protein LOKVESSMR4R_02567 [Yoonia vestfoldensis]
MQNSKQASGVFVLPKFTLELSTEAIRLLFDLHGQPCVIGDVTPSSRHLDHQMAALLGLAARLSKPPIVTTIVVPREHVLYKTLYVDLTVDLSEHQIVDYICGVTELTKDAICVDWVVVGSAVHIAAVEKLTLLEAGEFAKRHGFVTDVFTSHALTGQFPRQPVFNDPRTLKRPSFMPRQQHPRQYQDGQ